MKKTLPFPARIDITKLSPSGRAKLERCHELMADPARRAHYLKLYDEKYKIRVAKRKATLTKRQAENKT